MGPGTSVSTTASAPNEATSLAHPVARHDEALRLDSESSADGAADPCPVQETIRLVGRKWHLILLWELSQRPAGFNELKQRATGISAKMLSQSLHDLEHEDLVVRDVITHRPLRVMYHLTEKAEELAVVFDSMRAWGERHGVAAAARAARNGPEPRRT